MAGDRSKVQPARSDTPLPVSDRELKVIAFPIKLYAQITDIVATVTACRSDHRTALINSDCRGAAAVCRFAEADADGPKDCLCQDQECAEQA
jgi:hypothetical protein